MTKHDLRPLDFKRFRHQPGNPSPKPRTLSDARVSQKRALLHRAQDGLAIWTGGSISGLDRFIKKYGPNYLIFLLSS